jgi:transposase
LKNEVNKLPGELKPEMSLKAEPLGAIPEDTRSIGQELLAEDDLYRIIGEQYAELVKDEEFAALYSKTGQPAYSPARLSLATVLQAMEHLSDRAARQMVRTRIGWKYALHLSLSDPGFDASVLCEFRQRLLEGKAERKFFDALLEKFKEQGLLKGRGMQRTDSLQILAAVRDLNRLELVMESLRLALDSLVKADAGWVREHVPSDWFETYGEWIESERLVKEKGSQGKAETERMLKQTGKDGFWLLEQLGSFPQLRAMEEVKRLEKVWGQQYRWVETKSGAREIEVSTKESRRADGVDREMIVTPHDEEARYSEKRGEGSTGYKLHLTETAEEDAPALITDVEVVGGQEYDGGALAGIHQRLKEREILPEGHLADKGYVDGKTIEESRERGVELIGPIQGAPNSQALKEAVSVVGLPKGEEETSQSQFNPSSQDGNAEVIKTCLALEHFQFDFQQQRAICPQGAPSLRWVKALRRDRGPSETGQEAWLIYWEKQRCLSCRLALPSLVEQQRGRIVKLSPSYPTIVERRAEQHSKEFNNKYRRRSGIEASLSTLVRGYGGRRTPYRGRAKTRAHHLRIASAMNLKRAIAWEQGDRPQRKRVVRMKKVMGLEKTTRQGWRQKAA